jgi:cytochrome c oxidase subunit 2
MTRRNKMSRSSVEGEQGEPALLRRPLVTKTRLSAQLLAAIGCLNLFLLSVGEAWAQIEGRPTPGGISLPTAATPVGRETQAFYNETLLPIISIIPLFVLALLVYVMWRFSAKNNQTPSKFTHNIPLEVVWTAIPCLILLYIAVPSARLMKHQVEIPAADVTIKVTAAQWYWRYDYPKDQGGGFTLEQRGKADNELQPGDLRMLAVDNEAVVPINEVIKIQLTSEDVIHAFGVPAFAVRMDAIPGRLNETWFKIEKEGVYYGNCYFICGKDHAYMPIAIRAVSRAEYDKWLVDAKKKFASGTNESEPSRITAAAAP